MKKQLLKSFLIFAAMLSGAGAAQATLYNVQVGSSGFNANTFTPNTLTVNVGDTIEFDWAFGTHNVTSTSVPAGAATFASPTQTVGATFLVIPTVAGNYDYHCTLHAIMTGSFTVNGATTPPPTPSVTPTGPLTMCSGGSTMLMATSTGATGWQWSESGNPISGATSDMYLASTAGSYTVVATNANGTSSASAPVVLTVNTTPTLSAIQTNPNVCQGKCDTITFSGATTYTITTNPQNLAVITGNTVIVCPTTSVTPGGYNFSIEGTDNGCHATLQQTVIVISQPTASFTQSHTGLTFTFTNTSTGAGASGAVNYSWDFGDGQSSGAMNPPAHTYANPGTYTVTLTVDNGSGCSSVATQQAQTLGVGNIPGAEHFSFSPNPATNLLNVHTGGLQAELNLLDYTGKLIRNLNTSGNASDYSVNISDIPAGLYMLQIKANGNVAMEKLLIQK